MRGMTDAEAEKAMARIATNCVSFIVEFSICYVYESSRCSKRRLYAEILSDDCIERTWQHKRDRLYIASSPPIQVWGQGRLTRIEAWASPCSNITHRTDAGVRPVRDRWYLRQGACCN